MAGFLADFSIELREGTSIKKRVSVALMTLAQSVLNCGGSVSPSAAEIEDSRSEVSPRGGKESKPPKVGDG